ncbi:MAG: YlxR family protein [Tissierellaceae bacterium]|nr:YlxR family protein [Tissierellaceae bacterium]
MKIKKVPLRKCIGCGENKPKKELIRIVKNVDRGIIIDLTGKVNGRGAYICSNINCLEKAQRSKSLSRALEGEIPEDIYNNLKEVIRSQKNQ